MKRHLLLMACVVIGLLPAAACIVQPEQANLDGKDIKAVFLHTSDIHSRLVPYEMNVMLTDQKLGLSPANAPYGGITRLAAVVKQERRDNPRVAYIESGDVFQGAPIFNTFHGEVEFKAMSQLRVDAFAIGNHEFDNGAIALVGKAINFATFPMLGANYMLGDPHFPGKVPTREITEPYTIINLKGLRVGVIGMAAIGGGSSGAGAKGVRRMRDRDVVQSWVDFLRPIVDVVAVTSHVGFHEDLEYIPRTEGIDIVFGGHLHIALDPPNVLQDCDITKLQREIDRYRCDTPEKLARAQAVCEVRVGCEKKTGDAKTKCKRGCVTEAKADCAAIAREARYSERIKELEEDISFLRKRNCHPRDVLLVHSGAFLKYIGRLEATFRQCRRLTQTRVCAERAGNGKCLREVARRCVGNRSGASNDWEVISHKYRLIPVDNKLPEEPQMARMMTPYLLRLNQEQTLSRVIGYTPKRIFRFSKGPGDAQLGNLVCDAMMSRNQVWADFAINNTLGTRTDLTPGPVDEEQMNNVFPFENSITVMHLSGYEVQEVMDFVAHKSYTRGCQSQAQVAGMTVTLNCKGCPGTGGNRCSLTPYNGGPCAQNITIGGSGRACKTNDDCKDKGEICTGQSHPDGSGRKRCWMPINCATVYRLATNNYVANGGSGFVALAKNTTQTDLKIQLREVAKDYMQNMPACSQLPQTFAEKKAGKALSYVVGETERKALKALETLANDKKTKESGVGYTTYYNSIKARRNKAKGVEQTALDNYLNCLVEKPDSKTLACTGLTCRELKQCKIYKHKDMAKCEALARVRSALRCITVPCIQAREDGRIQRILRDASASPHWDDQYAD